MPNNILQTSGAGLGGGIFGAVLALFGIKSRIDRIEDQTVRKDLCNDRYKNLNDKLDVHTKKLDTQDVKLDKILNKIV